MSFVARNHPQQTAVRGALDDVDDRRTPPELLAECMELAGVAEFDLDVAANNDNAVARYWYTLTDSGLDYPWYGNVWCNPPYSDIQPWVITATRTTSRCKTIAMLLPANRTEQAWWQDLIEPGRIGGAIDVYFLRGRRRFDRPGWIPPAKGDRPPFGLALVVWKCAA